MRNVPARGSDAGEFESTWMYDSAALPHSVAAELDGTRIPPGRERVSAGLRPHRADLSWYAATQKHPDFKLVEYIRAGLGESRE